MANVAGMWGREQAVLRDVAVINAAGDKISLRDQYLQNSVIETNFFLYSIS